MQVWSRNWKKDNYAAAIARKTSDNAMTRITTSKPKAMLFIILKTKHRYKWILCCSRHSQDHSRRGEPCQPFLVWIKSIGGSDLVGCSVDDDPLQTEGFTAAVSRVLLQYSASVVRQV